MALLLIIIAPLELKDPEKDVRKLSSWVFSGLDLDYIVFVVVPQSLLPKD